MKLISPEQRARVRLRCEIAASAVLATVLVSTVIVIGSPGYSSTMYAITGA